MLHRLPKWVIPILMVALLLLGLLIPSNWAGIFIVLIAVFLGWLLALSWPVILPGSRLFRLARDRAGGRGRHREDARTHLSAYKYGSAGAATGLTSSTCTHGTALDVPSPPPDT